MAQITEIRIEDHSDEFKKAMKNQMKNALWAIGAAAEGHAKDMTPVDTGRLRNSISHEEDESELAVYIGTNVEYAPYVEMGTSRQRAHHMLQNAVSNYGDEYKAIINAAADS